MANLISFIVGIIGNIISILVFLSPIRTFQRIVKRKSTEDYESLPYITALLTASLWTFYGLIKPGGLLVSTVNGAGSVLECIYVTLFLMYAPKGAKVRTMKIAGFLNVGFFGLVIAIALLAIHGKMQITFVGVICSGLTVGMYASPLSAMKTVLKTKSVVYMPFFLSFFLFLNAAVWSVYSILVKDIFLGVPNAVGLVLGSAQLIMYSVYKNKSINQSTRSTEEEGSIKLPKGAVELHLHEENHGQDHETKIKNRNHKANNPSEDDIILNV
uniref:Bidirectional sugar transporter SWEET n=1 Tax=Paeonia suffruticosa TaxID=45171 RepID=A0A5C1IWG0_PAESU|nr:bidirectional sugar transporter SWEET17 [Paeonia suffruticosa]